MSNTISESCEDWPHIVLHADCLYIHYVPVVTSLTLRELVTGHSYKD